MSRSSLTVRDHAIEVPGGRVFAREWTPHEARGVPFILLHDSLGCVDVWRDFPAMLAAATARTVIAYDRLGFGRSDARHDSLSSSFVREESELYLPHILRALRLETFIPFGHSVGGGMAMYCGVTLPRMCPAIITESAQMFAEPQTLHAIADAKEAYANPERLAKLQKYHGAKAPWVLRAWTDTWLSPEFSNWTLRDTLPAIRCPVLALHGDLDEFGSLEHPRMIETLTGGYAPEGERTPEGIPRETGGYAPNGERCPERIPRETGRRAEAVILNGIGHVPHREQPLAIVELIGRFLEQWPGTVRG